MRRVIELRQALILVIIVFLVIIAPLLMPLQHVSDRMHIYTVQGILSTDSYTRYPYDAKNLEIGFSRFGELVTPQNASYIEDKVLTGRGLSYDGHEAFAFPDGNGYYPLEGWLLQYSYFDPSLNRTESGLAYALYSDLGKKIPEAGRTSNLLAEPIEILYDGPRRFIARTKVHVLHELLPYRGKNVINLEQTIIFNRASKNVVILMDVAFLEPADKGPVSISISRRVNFKLAQSLVSKNGNIGAYAQLKPNIETPYKYPGWPGHQTIGYYDAALVYVTSELTGGPSYTGFAAYWPNSTSIQFYGWDEWNKTIEGRQPAKVEPNPVLLINEWDTVISPTSSKRFVVVYGIVDGEAEGNQEMQLQLDRVFTPWDLYDATTNTTYQWVLLGRDSGYRDFSASKLLNESIPATRIGFDMFNPGFMEDPYLFSFFTNAGVNRSDYDSRDRLHLREKSEKGQIVGSNLIVLGGVAANLATEYFNDYTDAFFSENGVLAPSSWNNKFYHRTPVQDDNIGYAVIAATTDLNGTSALIIWGLDARDTYYTCSMLKSGLLKELQTMPRGVTSLILRFNYGYSMLQHGFVTIIKRLGTISEFEIHE